MKRDRVLLIAGCVVVIASVAIPGTIGWVVFWAGFALVVTATVLERLARRKRKAS